MFKFLIIAGGLYYLFRLVTKPNSEINTTDYNEEIPNSNNPTKNQQKADDDIEYTDYEEIE